MNKDKVNLTLDIVGACKCHLHEEGAISNQLMFHKAEHRCPYVM
jgi:hypothetical protein